MRSYKQFCGLAKALDVIGDRWTLLIVRELLIRGSARYSELQHGLPGIPTNLLAQRMRQLERSGVVERAEARAGFRLTHRGQALESVIDALGRWASPFMGAPGRNEQVRDHWFILPMRLYLRDDDPGAGTATVQIELPDQPIVLRTNGDGSVSATAGRAGAPDATLAGTPAVVMSVLSGRLGLSQARGLRFSGNRAVLSRLSGRQDLKADRGQGGPSTAAKISVDRRSFGEGG
jgi:DNA-binding HxlR family transcriptional regulator